MVSKIKYLRVGKIEKLNDKQSSAINKKNVDSSYLTKVGFEDDEQANRKYHGGENKAVLFFSTKTYKKIEEILDISLEYEKSSLLGENILVDDFIEDDICVGDIFKLGEAIIQVTQPREPCNTLSLNTNQKDMLKTIYENGFTGWYVKVLEEGIVKKGDEIILEKRIYPNLSIKVLNDVIKNSKTNSFTQESISCEVLGKPFKEEIIRRLES